MNQKISLSWNQLQASIQSKIILHPQSGIILPGQIVALMGPSGAGKTTFLSLLASKTTQNLSVKGQVNANGMKFNRMEYYSFGSFVYQNDLLFEVLTVRQNIQFAVNLKLNKSHQQKQEKVDQLINLFNLTKCQNTYIGGKFVQGISGGQRKRTCIAIQLVANPSLLLLDEPTSGLDSTTAFNIVTILQNLAKMGKTIIFTIHQPSSKIYNTLTKLILLHKGQTIYQGDALGIVNYMQKLNIEVPKNFNISDFFMFELSDYKRKITGKQSSLNHKSYLYVMYKQFQMIEPNIKKKPLSNINQQTLKSSDYGYSQKIQNLQKKQQIGYHQIQTSTSAFYQIIKIFQRSFKNYMRHPMMLKSILFRVLVNIITIGGIFFGVGNQNKPAKNQVVSFDQLQNYLFGLQGVLFVCVLTNFVVGAFSVILVFPSQRQIFTKQTSSKTYRVGTYFIGKLLLQIPLCLLFPILFGSAVYWMIGLSPNVNQFFQFLLALIVTALSGNALGLMGGSIFSNSQTAKSIGTILILPLMIVSGVYNRTDTMGEWIKWLIYISPFHYGYQSLVYNQLKNEQFNIRTPQGIYKFWPIKELGIEYTAMQNERIFMCIVLAFYLMSYLILKYFPVKLAL